MQSDDVWPAASVARALGMALALLCAGCGGGGGDAPAAPAQPVPVIVQGQRLSQDWQGAPLIPKGTYVLQSQEEFAALWNGAPPPFGDTRSPYVPPPVPSSINFQTSTAVAVSLGFGNFCHNPQITEISNTAGTLLVKYDMLDPAITVCTSAALHYTEMMDVIIIPKFTGPVVFQARVVVF